MVSSPLVRFPVVPVILLCALMCAVPAPGDDLVFRANPGGPGLALDSRLKLFSLDQEVIFTANEAVVASPRGMLRIGLDGSSSSAQVEGAEPVAFADGSFRQVRYGGVYPGVDLLFSGRNRRLGMSLELAPGADPASIRLVLQGADRIQADSQGNLLLVTPAGVLTLYRPSAWQRAGGAGRRKVAASYTVESGQTRIGFTLGDYNAGEPLVIEPALDYSPLFGAALFGTRAEVADAVRGNAGFRAASIPANDDGSGPTTPIGFTVSFFGRTFTNLFVNNNGNVTFDAELPTYTPFPLTNTQRIIIAPFFADVDTRGQGSGLVTYGADTVDGRRAFGANFINTGYYDTHVDKLNSFQVVVIDRADIRSGDFDFEFNYNTINWETGDASGGVNGFGGVPARVGYSNGTGAAGTFFELPGSAVAGSFLDSNTATGLSNTRLNSDVRGRYLFRVRNGSVEPPPATVTFTVSPGSHNIEAGPAAPSSISFEVRATQAAQTVNWTAALSFLNGQNWLALSPASGTARSDQPTIVRGTINYGVIAAAGVYQAIVTFTDTNSRRSVSVPVTVAVGGGGPRLQLSHSSMLFSAIANTSVQPPPQTLRIFNAGSGSLSWTLAGLPSWLTASASSGSVAGATPSTVTLTANPSGFGAGVNQALLTVSAAGVETQYVSVTFHVVPATTPPAAAISPTALAFVAISGSAAPPSQAFHISNSGGGTLAFSLTPTVVTGGNWMSVTPVSGSTASGPVEVRVSVNLVGVPVGLHRARIVLTSPSTTVPQEIEVLLVLAPPDAAVTLSAGARSGAGSQTSVCTPQSLDLVSTTLATGSALAVSFPRVILALVVDSCGNSIGNATVVTTAGDAGINMQALGNGLYTGTFTPSSAVASLPITVSASHPTFPAGARRTYTVSAAAAAGGARLPVLVENGVVEGAGFTPRRPLSPGGIVSLFGTQFATANAGASSLPLPRSLGGVSVRIGSQAAPLYFVSAGQINAQVPFELAAGSTVPIVVTTSSGLTAPQNYVIAPVQPGVFRGSGTGAAVLDARFAAVTAQNQAVIGEVIQIFTTGLGLTDVAVPTGTAAPPTSNVRLPVTVTIGGVPAPVQYQGLAPGFVGLYQVNAVVPASVTPGLAVPLVITQNGIPSNPDAPTTIPVRAP